MKSFKILLIVLISIYCVISCTKEPKKNILTSPDGNLKVEFLIKETKPYYKVDFKDKCVIGFSSLGFEFKDMQPIAKNIEIICIDTMSQNSEWEMPWGEKRIVNDNFKQMKVYLEETESPYRKMNVIFKVYNDGLGFRYEFPEQEEMKEVLITEENTQFKLTGDHTCWWIPGDWDIYEHRYTTSKFSDIDAISKNNDKNLAQTSIPVNAVNTPVTMKTKDGLHLSFHEANLTNYAGMTLKIDNKTFSMQSGLVGSDRVDYKVKRLLPFVTPWRTIQISETAGRLIESDLIVNLNEPNKLGDISWFAPMKYVGIWWEMHVGKSTWDYAATQDMNSFKDGEPHGKHGATTENAKRYIDFAAKNNIGGLLVEGWNTGWEHWIGFEDREGVFDFVTPYPDYDLQEVVRYGKEKGVELIMHHETSAAPRTYEQQLDTAYKLMESLDIHSVKTGYVGKIIPKGEYHHGQWMVSHYRKVLETAAKYKIAINAHEPIKATGLRRTYPNAIAREGLRGQEFNAWASDGGNPPEHLSIVAFTRMLAGPIDFTPGVFNIKLEPYKENNQINTTLAHQLALYVVIYSPVQMACDLPENYENHPAFKFIRDVGVNWEQTKVLSGEVGDFIVIARQERETGNWFVGGITDEKPREIEVKFDFLSDEHNYKTIIYRDAKDAHWDKNPTAYEIEHIKVDKNSIRVIKLAPGGGFAISLMRDFDK